ncbi:inorganic diphosphatase [Arvimicrobium flavum]|uniref:inorganic diphosphatase n=1 Tax=Arvimicrobium flavum TaxID=3393320 RepID=UPI00237A83FE|nr:inorganic diphosphatase [Mesorhizobium shangrilense]
MRDFLTLPARNEDRVRFVVETPRGSTCKLAYKPEVKAFIYVRPLPLGTVYPYDWGFIPSTKGEDGDPLDGLVIHESATAPGVIIECRLLGVLRVRQTNADGTVITNDRYMLAPCKQAAPYAPVTESITPRVQGEIEQFFRAAVHGAGKQLDFEGWGDADAAAQSLEQGCSAFQTS